MQVNSRLFEIVYLLLKKKKVTAKELAERFEVSTRTIYRDIEVLSRANIPIYATKGKDGGIGLLEEFVLNKTVLSEEEQNQILFALQGMDKVTGQAGNDIVAKLSTIFQKEADDWLKIDFSNWGKEGSQKEWFAVLKKAILHKKLVQFIYYNTNGQKSKRTVEPLQIWFKDKSWYLVSYCRQKEDYRIFKIARMKEIEVLNEHFERTLPGPPTKQEKAFPTITLQLEINKEMAYRVYDEFEPDEVTLKENGDFVITVEYPENDWVYGYILSFGETAKVLAPETAKAKIQEKLEKMLKKYA